MTPGRRIAAHWLWTPQGMFRHPVVTLSPEGRPAGVTAWSDPDRLASTEFYAGVLVFDFPRAWAEAFAQLRRTGEPLPGWLQEQVPAKEGCTVVLSGLDYTEFRLTEQACIRCIDTGKFGQPPVPAPE